MSNSSLQRKRWTLAPPKATLTKVTDFFRRSDVWVRVGLCLVMAAILWVVMAGWEEPFSYRVREAPIRDLHARTTFEYQDLQATDQKKQSARRNILCYYVNDQQLLEQLRQALTEEVFAIKSRSFDELKELDSLKKFFPVKEEEPADADSESQPEPSLKENFERFRTALEKDEKLDAFRAAIDKSFIDIDKTGLLDALDHGPETGSLQEIDVYLKGDITNSRRVPVTSVRIAEVATTLKTRIIEEMTLQSESISDASFVANAAFVWLQPQLKTTLAFDDANTQNKIRDTLLAIKPVLKTYLPGEPLDQFNAEDMERRGIKSGVPINEADLKLLRAEHEAKVNADSWQQQVARSLSFFGLFSAVFTMLVQFLYFRDRHLIDELPSFALLLIVMSLTLVSAWMLTLHPTWRAEVIPFVLCAMILAITYRVELALFVSGLLCFSFCVAHSYGLGEFVVLMAAASTSAFYCRSIRSRTRLVNVGLIAAATVFPTVIGVQYMLGQPFGSELLTDAILFSAGTFAAGLLMTNLLPYLEGWFDIETDARLLELSDANHPLLRELVQRAPGTYNHSINVASISEAAAEAIGANGLLCRVAAYFHDIGKLQKPDYFIENQAGGINKHDDLTPSMSTLVIVAHVKDGVEIGRKHKLPPRIIDLIEQHHGTTLVEYFYNRAKENAQQESDEEVTVDEGDFRYPGPRPQTREAAVMMLADAVESASRALREPTPARIENLVNEISKKKFADGQFDQCDITIEEVKTICDCLVKSLNAMYHARVKYPEQPVKAN